MIRTALLSRLNILRIVAAWGMVFLFSAGSEVLAAHGYNAPSLEETYAASEISPRDHWQIYLKGSDPDGDLKFIHVWLNIPGVPTTPNRLRIDPDQGSDVSGYLKLTNLIAGDISHLFGPPISLRVTLEDRAGHRSETVELPLTFYLGVEQSAPTKPFENRFLGRIPGLIFGRGISL